MIYFILYLILSILATVIICFIFKQGKIKDHLIKEWLELLDVTNSDTH